MARGRKKLIVDEKIIYDWARVGCSAHIIADYLGISDALISKRYSHIMRRARAEYVHDILQAQYKSALSTGSGAISMQRWLGQQACGQKEIIHVDSKSEESVTLSWPEGDKEVGHEAQDNSNNNAQASQGPTGSTQEPQAL